MKSPAFARLGLLLLAGLSCLGYLYLEAQGQRPAKDATAERAEGIVRKSLAAYGGESKSLSFQNATLDYQIESMGDSASKPLQVKAYLKGADFFRSDVVGEKSNTITILNHDKGWIKIDDTVLSLSKKNLGPLKVEVISQLRPDLLLLSFQKFRYHGRTEEEGHKLDEVDVSGFLGGEYTRGRLSFDLSTYLVYKYEFESERESASGKGIFHGKSVYLKYDEMEGLRIPVEIVASQGAKVSKITVKQVDLKTVLDPGIFADPLPPSPEQKK
ncbi:MAG: hypothetical protein U0V70_09255 [Terriglobia bacterium]